MFGMALLLACGIAEAQIIQQGRPAPPAVVEQIKDVPLTRIGSQSVRALPPATLAGKHANGASAAATEGRTLVARESDNLVGVSNNELVIIEANLDAVAAKVASLQLAGAQTHPYPRLQLLVVKTARFEQLETVSQPGRRRFPERQI